MTERARSAQVPLHVLLELTYRCNVRCVHCYLAGREPEMSLGEIEALLDDLAAEGTLFLTLSGGEILLRKDLFAVGAAARARGFALRLFTNGTLIDERAAERIAALDPMLVEISLLGGDAETHDGITLKRGSFQRTLAGARRLRARGVRLKLKSTLLDRNDGQVAAMEAIAAELGVPLQVTDVVMPRKDGSQDPLRYRSSLERLDRYERRRRHDLLEAGGEPTEHLCGAGRASCSISPSGDVYPCVLMPLRAGNVRSEKFGEIWRHAPAFRTMRALLASHRVACTGCDESGHDFCPAREALMDGGTAIPAADRLPLLAVAR